MKPESPASPPRQPRRYVPKFAPVPLRYRKDGWTPLRQADFLGALAETGSIAAAAHKVGMTRESAYRLRARPGALSFAQAWDAVLAPPLPAIPKFTLSPLIHRALHGTLKPVMRSGKHVATVASPDNDALLRAWRQADSFPPARRGSGKSQPK